jgi:hypothetical protein
MYKNFNITESEKEQILNRLKENGYGQSTNKKVISEQGEPEDVWERLSNMFDIRFKDEHGILYLLRSKRGKEYGVFNKSKMDWEHGYQPSFQESGIKLYQTQTGEFVLIEKYIGIDDKVFYILLKIDGDDYNQSVKFLNTREYYDVVKNLKDLDDTDETLPPSADMRKRNNDKVYEENPINEGKQILIHTFKKLIK